MTASFDNVLVDGTEQQLRDYAYDGTRSLVVDWRDQDDWVVEEAAKLIPEAELSFVWAEDGEDLRVTYKGREADMGLTSSTKDRRVVLHGLNQLLQGDYEIRAFIVSYGSDTLSFYIKPRWWWVEMDQQFPRRMLEVFAPFETP